MNMKKLLYIILIAPFFLSTCSEELERDWNNPNVYKPEPDEVVSGLFTHMQKNRFWLKDYGEWYWFLSGWYQSFVGVSQIGEFLPYSESYINIWADYHYGELDDFMDNANGNTYQRFERSYTDMTNYGLIRDEITDLQKKGNDTTDAVIYLRLATILKDVVALQTVDLFNSIPYFNAFRGSEGVFFTPYDDPLEIYKAVLEKYQSIAQELPDTYGKMSDLGKTTFATQDVFFKGDISKWVQYINAQTLRSSIRISGVAADYVKPIIAKAVTNLPKEDFTFLSPQVNENRIGVSAGGIFQRGLYEQFYALAVPDIIMTRMNRGSDLYELNVDDPRLPVISMGFTQTGTADEVEYYGVSGNWERNKYLRTLPVDQAYPIDSCKRNVYPQVNAQYNVISPNRSMDIMVQACPWTFYNPVTYVFTESPLDIFTLAEVDLLLAEVELKGLASTGKSAGQHINDAVAHSTDFWYMMNSVTNYVGTMSDETKKILTPDKPNAGIINAYASTIQSEFEAAAGTEGKMEILMQQKYIHLNILEAFELFAELRRTRHPKLEPITCKGTDRNLINATMMLERFKLPPSERTNNYDEYSKVMKDDNWATPIFWVPQDKINEKYYLPEAIKAPLP
jgi:hypothetical protein